MMRPSTYAVFPDFWAERKAQGLCPVCGKIKKEFDKHMRVYCCFEHAQKYGECYKTWNVVRDDILKRDNNHCVKCGSTQALEIDHIEAFVNGGKYFDYNNLQTLCHKCHVRKTKQDLWKARNKGQMLLTCEAKP
ncbi:MAG: HNH endonuclease [Candidatus Bathyarchaeia archaeon]